MFTIQAAVTIVTAGLASSLFGINIDIQTWTLIILLISGSVLTIGKFKLLDNMMKCIHNCINYKYCKRSNTLRFV